MFLRGGREDIENTSMNVFDILYDIEYFRDSEDIENTKYVRKNDIIEYLATEKLINGG